MTAKLQFFPQIVFYSLKSNYGLVTFGVYFGILKPKHAHCEEHRWRQRENEADSLFHFIIYKYFTIVATNSVYILVFNSLKQLHTWEIDNGVTLTLTMITLRLKPVFILTTSQP